LDPISVMQKTLLGRLSLPSPRWATTIRRLSPMRWSN